MYFRALRTSYHIFLFFEIRIFDISRISIIVVIIALNIKFCLSHCQIRWVGKYHSIFVLRFCEIIITHQHSRISPWFKIKGSTCPATMYRTICYSAVITSEVIWKYVFALDEILVLAILSPGYSPLFYPLSGRLFCLSF